jgi:hypothetical protein
VIVDNPIIRQMARAWMRSFKLQTPECEVMLLTYSPSGAPAFDLEAILIQQPTTDALLQGRVENASWRVFFLKEDLYCEGRLTRDPDNSDRITLDGTEFFPGVVNVRSNGTVECFLMTGSPTA